MQTKQYDDLYEHLMGVKDDLDNQLRNLKQQSLKIRKSLHEEAKQVGSS